MTTITVIAVAFAAGFFIGGLGMLILIASLSIDMEVKKNENYHKLVN